MTDENPKVVEEDATEGNCRPVSGDVCDPSTASVANDQDPASASSLGSAGNALRHGLTARTALPKALRLRTEHYLTELRDELSPVGCLESVLVERNRPARRRDGVGRPCRRGHPAILRPAANAT